MRKFRNAAIAGMTAVTLVAGLNTTAFAEPKEPATTETEKSDTEKTQADAIKDGKPASERESYFTNEGASGEKKGQGGRSCNDRLADLATDGKLLDFDKVRLGDLGCKTRNFEDDLKDYAKKPTNSSVWGKRYDAVQDVYGVDLLGQDKNFAQQPVWSQIWFVATILGVIGTVVGLGYLPVMNQLKAMGYII